MSTSSGTKSIQGGLKSQTMITECPLELFSSSGQFYSVLLDISRNIYGQEPIVNFKFARLACSPFRCY